MRAYSNWPWHLDEVFVKTNGETHNLWRAVDQEGEVLESYVTVTDILWFYSAAMKVIGKVDRQRTGRLLNNLAEISYMPFRRRGWAILRFWRMQILQNFGSGHSSKKYRPRPEYNPVAGGFALIRAALFKQAG